MSEIFLIGDTHFYDKNIIRFENRPFKTVEEMNKVIIDNWKRTVSKDDDVFVLGDFFGKCTYMDIDKVLNDNLPGHITLIRGNHDTDIQITWFKKFGINVIEFPIIIDGFYMLSHEPMYVSENSPYANVFAHIHNNPMYKTCSSRSFCVSAERIHYTPISLSTVKSSIMEINNYNQSEYGDIFPYIHL